MQKRLLPKPAESDTKEAKSGKQQPQQEEQEVVDLRDLNRTQRQRIVDNALATHEQSNEVLLEKYAERAQKYVSLLYFRLSVSISTDRTTFYQTIIASHGHARYIST